MKLPTPSIIGFAVALLMLAAAVSAEEKEHAPVLRVALDIAGSEELKVELYGCLEKNLTRFEDIAIVGKDPLWTLDIIGVKAPMRNLVAQDYVFSLAVLGPEDEPPYRRSVLRGHELLVGHPRIETGCKSIAVLFVRKYLKRKTEGVIERYD